VDLGFGFSFLLISVVLSRTSSRPCENLSSKGHDNKHIKLGSDFSVMLAVCLHML